MHSNVAVGETATLLFDPSSAYGYDTFTLNVKVDGERSPGGVVYVGGPDVTAAQTDATKGRRLADGDVLDLGVARPGEKWYARTRATTGTVYVSVLHPRGE